MKTFKIRTFGCKVNQYDTQNIREQFLRAGFAESASGRAADICLINTCTVTARADNESLASIRRVKRENPGCFLVVTGCLAELDRTRVKKEGADLVVKNRDKRILLRRLRSLRPPNEAAVTAAESSGISSFEGRTRAFLKIQDGCDNFCSYCKVPFVRGRSTSRPVGDIVNEAKILAGNGYKEIVLTGVCLGSYRPGLVKVISALEKIEGLLRIRLSSIEAGDVTDALINKISSSAKLCPHLHIPVQSGDNRVLAKMNRKYTREGYSGLIEKIRHRIPDVSITTDVLIGFPGETEDNFLNTVSLIERILPLKAHIFPYSKREATSAAKFGPDIDPAAVRKRVLRLREIAQNCALAYKKRFIGRTLQVLMEEHCKGKPGFWQGYSANYMNVLVRSNKNLKNSFIPLKIRHIINGELTAHFC